MKHARTVSTTLLAVIAAAVMVGPASAGPGEIHPTFREERTYFHCPGPTAVYTLSQFPRYTPATWDTTPPADSFQQGGGCVGAEYGGFTNQIYDVAFEGTFIGNVRDLTIEIHQALVGNVRTTSTETLRLNMWIDNQPLFPPGTQPANGKTVTVTPVPAGSGTSEKFEFSITNIGYANEVRDEQGNVARVDHGGAAIENGDGQQEHSFVIFLGTHGNGTNTDVKSKLGVWAWDSADVPSGIRFNPPALAPAQVAADLPSYAN